ncbi:MAG TPA: hypothetical protein DCZ94_02335 [Lentisphaeria bacterium]|nr:MAG: hypothetical protein A2X48_16215 [Lentisphaerae bacterium GWF2_49_21]HBC85772.1 hypothetical protein [Lentisphaeria bacterium]
MSSIILFLGIIGGFFLPGFLLNRILGKENDLGAAFIISIVILFHLIFWTGISGIRISLLSIGVELLILNAALFTCCLKKKISLGFDRHPVQFTRLEKIAIIPIGLSIILMFLKSSVFQLPHGDQDFRWFFLPLRILETGSFDYYPPLTPSHYEVYFFAESFPPIVSFTYYWLYALFGKAENVLFCIPVTIQMILILVFGYRLSTSLFNSKNAGIFAILLIGSSTMLFYSVAISQETGITALSLAALVFFLVQNESCSPSDACLAAFSASLGALSREYGGIIIVCGLVVIFWRRMPLRILLYYLLFCFILSGPWYIRTFILTGNPFYSNPLLNIFPVNPVHAGIIGGYKEAIGLKTYLNWQALNPLALGLSLALGLPFFLGISAIFKSFRKLGALFIITILFFSLWIYSIWIPAGLFHSMRILTPIILILAICGSSLLDMPSLRTNRRHLFVLFGLSFVCYIAFIQNIFVPFNPLNLQPKDMLMAASIVPDSVNMKEVVLNDVKDVPENSAILSDGALHHAFLAMDKENSKNIRIVPVWSPEVRFLFEKETDFEKGVAGLKNIGIRYVLIGQRGNLNMIYLRKFDFFNKLSLRSRHLDQEEKLFALP